MTVTRESSTNTFAPRTATTSTARRSGLRAGATLLTVLAIVGSVGCASAAEAAVVTPPALFVSPTGTGPEHGLSTARPFKTIQHALDLAQPGTTISLGPGSYRESVDTKVDGTAQAPITIRGTGAGTGYAGAPAVTVYGTGHVFDIYNSYYRLDGFAVNGEEGTGRQDLSRPCMSPAVAFKDANQSVIVDSRPIYVSSPTPRTASITNVTIANMTISGSGGECIRLRNTSNSAMTNSIVSFCGMTAKQTDGAYLYHNGEGIYIGTSPKAGHTRYDSSFNVMTGNRINTFGSECLDVKENSHDNMFSNNDCGFNIEPAEYYGSNIELRGHNNTVTGNRISHSVASASSSSPTTPTLDLGNNSVTRNFFSDQPELLHPQ